MRIFLINWNYEEENFLEAAKRVESAGHEILYWSGPSFNEIPEAARKNFFKTIFHKRVDAIAGIPAESFKDITFAAPSENLIKSLYEAESILSTLKQFEKLKLSSFQKKCLYHKYLEYWSGVIDKLRPEAIIFAYVPHSGYDFIVYSLAKYFKIKTFIIEGSGISDRHLLVRDYAAGSLPLKEEIEKNKNKQFSLDDLAPDIKEFFLSQTDEKKDTIVRNFKALRENFYGWKILKFKFRIIFKSIADFTIFKKIYFYFVKKIGDNIFKEYHRSQSPADLNKKFVFAALHYQPESATAPLGGVFVDQLLILKILSQSLPEGWILYIKEHPTQLLIQGLNYTNFRYPGYYEEIAKLERVKLISNEIPATELIKKCQAVATVTGTAGQEALMRLKPAIIFGNAAYRDFPGVFRVNDVASCRAALSKIASGFSISRQDIINYLAVFDKISFHTYLEPCVEKFSKLTKAEHVEILSKIIIDSLK